jgi:hypothetical protein
LAARMSPLRQAEHAALVIMPKLTEQEISQIVDRVAHQGDGMGWAMGTFDLEIDEIEDIMLEANYERCPECGWFVECGELVDANMNSRPCSDCKPWRDDED